jgi:hypothetical protein
VNPVLSLALVVAASIHFFLLGEHAEESPFLAGGFLAAGILQLALATLVAVWPSRPAYRAVVVLDVMLVLFYVAHVVVGIPLPTGLGFELELSARESVDAYGVINLMAELAAVVLAYAGLLGRIRPQPAAG